MHVLRVGSAYETICVITPAEGAIIIKKQRVLRNILLAVAMLIIAFLIGILLEFCTPIISPEEFATRMEVAGYAVEEITPALEQIKTHLSVTCNVFSAEIMLHETMVAARHTFARLRNDLELSAQQQDVATHS